MIRATLAKQPHQVAGMFDGVARRYDLMNTLITCGFDRRWRRIMRAIVNAHAGDKVLDLAAGTGVSTEELAKSGAWCVAADFSSGMLRQGAGRSVPMVAADALQLPFADNSFDAVTVAFGFRNFVDPLRAATEIARIVKPGGKIVILETSIPQNRVLKVLLINGVSKAAATVGALLGSNSGAYGYFAQSLQHWLDPNEFATVLTNAGWSRVQWRGLTGGIVAIHSGTKPA